ncbi:MAG: type II toxin-antitoxin system HicA family toxin [Candidatus Diapherotrites archaeon]|uniref:Type II toxin-antitoxin system HicA family toxin n=1 Tax=Candidatus Iainarchaeum sp. TaxID=3101447 RepID=A0A8T4L2Q4_9ARCH|nr:type II toxin-antitoxin system HicA family toxin [Candidatus Diapherotrites archaeon]
MTQTLSPRDLFRALKKLGFVETRSRGSHYRFEHPDGRKTSVPVHGNEPIGPHLLTKIIKEDLRMNKDEFFRLLE